MFMCTLCVGCVCTTASFTCSCRITELCFYLYQPPFLDYLNWPFSFTLEEAGAEEDRADAATGYDTQITEQTSESKETPKSALKHPHIKHLLTVSSIIKLDYDTSDPIYNVIRLLILKFVLRWIMPGYHSKWPGSIAKLATPSPSLLSPMEESFVPKSADLMRDTWFTSRDNINLLFEIFHQVYEYHFL